MGGYKCKSDYLACIRWVHDAVHKKLSKQTREEIILNAGKNALTLLKHIQDGESNPEIF
jgi:hypothetical protein